MAFLKKVGRSLVLAATLLAAAAPTARAQISREYQIKAVFLFNFPQFVDWPPAAFDGAAAPLVIGVLGRDPFGSVLDDLVRGEKMNDRPLVVRRYRRIEDVTACQVLFISRSEAEQLQTIMARLRGRAILTVGDEDEFLRDGGMIRFATENNKTRLKIDVAAAKAADLTLSSKLLRRAEIVAPGSD